MNVKINFVIAKDRA